MIKRNKKKNHNGSRYTVLRYDKLAADWNKGTSTWNKSIRELCGVVEPWIGII